MARPHLSLILPPLAAPPATSAPPLLGAAVVRSGGRMLCIYQNTEGPSVRLYHM